MQSLLPVLVCAILLLLACRKPETPSPEPPLPAKGFYAAEQYAQQELAFFREIPYSTRPNFSGLQYTSERTRAREQGADTLTIRMDLLVPPNATPDKRQPLVVFIHGGGFENGDKAEGIEKGMSYAKAGYVLASINYRLTANNLATAERRYKTLVSAEEDTQNAIRFLKANAARYGVDTARICVMGTSAGGALALINAIEADSRLLRSDFPGFSSKVQAGLSTGATLVNEKIGGVSGLFHYDASDSPVLLFHARPTDSFTGATWTGNVLPTQAAITASGNECRVVAQPNMTHTIDMDLGGAYWPEIKPFLWKKLRLAELRE